MSRERYFAENYSKRVFILAFFRNFSTRKSFLGKVGKLFFQKRVAKNACVFLTLVLVCLCTPKGRWDANRGQSAYLKQKYKRAMSSLEKAEKKGYKAPSFNFMLGTSYLYMGRYEDAARVLSSAADDTAITWFALGNAYYHLGNYVAAGKAFRTAIVLNPEFLEAIEALAMLYPEGGVTRDEALALWKKALELEARDEWIIRAKHYIEQLENSD